MSPYVPNIQLKKWNSGGKFKREETHAYLWLTHVDARCGAWALGHTGFSSRGLCAQKLWFLGARAQAQELWCTGFSCSTACGIFPD